MKLRAITLGLVTLLVAAGAIAAVADDETEAFIREVIKDARTDSQRATLLMEAVSLAEGNRKLKVALLEKAVQYGIKGLKTIDDCSRFQGILTDLVKADPDRKSYWLSRRAAVCRRWFTLEKSLTGKRRLAIAVVESLSEAGSVCAAKGDWKKASGFFNDAKLAATAYKMPNSKKFMGYMRSASYLSKVQDKIAAHIETLKKSADDLDARSDLVTLLVTAMDDPAEAVKYVNGDVDEKFRTFVPMAVKDLSKLPVDACKNLGDWYYKELSKSVVALVKYRMLGRAKIYYERTLELHTGVDITSAALKLSLSQIKSDQDKLGNVDPLVCLYCFASGKIPCPACVTGGQASGLRKCSYCNGTGRGKCSKCEGAWRQKCSRCSGRGKYVSGTEKRGGVYHKNYAKCSTCAASGITHRERYTYTSSRSGTSSGKRSGTSSGMRSGTYSSTRLVTRPGSCPTCSGQEPEFRGTSECRHCSGKGGSGTCSTCDGAKTVMCTHCTAGNRTPPPQKDSFRKKESSKPSPGKDSFRKKESSKPPRRQTSSIHRPRD